MASPEGEGTRLRRGKWPAKIGSTAQLAHSPLRPHHYLFTPTLHPVSPPVSGLCIPVLVLCLLSKMNPAVQNLVISLAAMQCSCAVSASHSSS